MDKELSLAIVTMPGEDGCGWWSSAGEDAFNRIGKDLLEKGFTCKEAIVILKLAYSAVSDEFGG